MVLGYQGKAFHFGISWSYLGYTNAAFTLRKYLLLPSSIRNMRFYFFTENQVAALPCQNLGWVQPSRGVGLKNQNELCSLTPQGSALTSILNFLHCYSRIVGLPLFSRGSSESCRWQLLFMSVMRALISVSSARVLPGYRTAVDLGAAGACGDTRCFLPDSSPCVWSGCHVHDLVSQWSLPAQLFWGE